MRALQPVLVYHGPEGLKKIAEKVHGLSKALASRVSAYGFEVVHSEFFDTVLVRAGKEQIQSVLAQAKAAGVNLRPLGEEALSISFDETTEQCDVEKVVSFFVQKANSDTIETAPCELTAKNLRSDSFMQQEVFTKYRSETNMMRYIKSLERKDLSLTHSMIPLGSCTMKLNSSNSMLPLSWDSVGGVHPFAPREQTHGYRQITQELEAYLAEITGFDAVSLQPNSGAQGEYAGLCVIRGYHHSRGETSRNVCLIPESAHGTNPASAVLSGMKVVKVACDDHGNLDCLDLTEKAKANAENLCAMMITYPSTHGVFEESIVEVCKIIHGFGGLVYLDGANLNAQVGVCRPGKYGADVCHLNLHKTFSIPHGGGGPGAGPIAVCKKLAPVSSGTQTHKRRR